MCKVNFKKNIHQKYPNTQQKLCCGFTSLKFMFKIPFKDVHV